MSKIILATLVSLVTILAAQAQINVSGSAEIKAVPDEVDISTGVETRDGQLSAATQQNGERVARALAFLKGVGISDKDIQTASLEVQPDFGSDDSRVEPRFYRVRKSIEVKLKDVTKMEGVLTGLLTNGVNSIYDVQFKTTDLRKYRDQARQMAIKAAKEKADAMCAELDIKRGKPVSINAQDYGGYYVWPGGPWGWRNGGMNMNSFQNAAQTVGDGAAAGSVAIGQISVSATVNVSFAIE